VPLLTKVDLVGVALLGGDAGVVLVCSGLGAAFRCPRSDLEVRVSDEFTVSHIAEKGLPTSSLYLGIPVTSPGPPRYCCVGDLGRGSRPEGYGFEQLVHRSGERNVATYPAAGATRCLMPCANKITWPKEVLSPASVCVGVGNRLARFEVSKVRGPLRLMSHIQSGTATTITTAREERVCRYSAYGVCD
jgi:hypothetical protein